MLRRNSLRLVLFALVAPLLHGQSPSALSTNGAAEPSSSLPSPQIFAPGVISGPANDGSPTFSSDGNTLFFTRTNGPWTVILESHKVHGQWSHPTLAPFSGEWSDSSPGMSPDGTYLVFVSIRPETPPDSPTTAANPPKAAHPQAHLWRVDHLASGWTKPTRLPDTVNIGPSIWKPSIAADGTIYFVSIDQKGRKRLFSSQFVNGAYQQAKPLPFSDGTTSDVDPEIAPDGSFLVFCSAGRLPGNSKDHLFIVRRNADTWGPVVPIRYAEEEKNGYSTDDEPHLGPDHRTIYFSSDRVMPVHLPRSHEQARQDLERLELWDNSNTNVWSLPISRWLTAEPGSI